MMPALRFPLYVSTGGLFGICLFCLYALHPSERRAATHLAPSLAALAMVGLAISLLAFWTSVAGMMGVGLFRVDATTLQMMATSSATGVAMMVRSSALALTLVAIATLRRHTTGMVVACALLGAVAVATLAWNGHGAAGEGTVGWVRMVSDMAHMLAGFAWFGALLMFLWLVHAPQHATTARAATAHRALSAFAVTGTIIVTIIVVTGLANAFLIVGTPVPSAIHGSTYGALLLLKLALFAVMLGFAGVNRYRLTPKLKACLVSDQPVIAMRAMRRSLALELTTLVAILTIVSQLGMLEPGY